MAQGTRLSAPQAIPSALRGICSVPSGWIPGSFMMRWTAPHEEGRRCPETQTQGGVDAKLPPCLVGMEACGSAHYWAREINSEDANGTHVNAPAWDKGSVNHSHHERFKPLTPVLTQERQGAWPPSIVSPTRRRAPLVPQRGGGILAWQCFQMIRRSRSSATVYVPKL